ncbi:MAG: glycosyltransferase family 1 protein [Hafnia sp.]
MLIVIDARMICASGIGTYIKNLIREIIESGDAKIHCIISNGDQGLISSLGVTEYTIFKSKYFSPFEQIEYIFRLPRGDVFWTPHFNSPIFLPPRKFKARVATIHDMFPFAYEKNFSKLKRFYIQTLIKMTCLLSDKIFTVSNFSKSEIIKYLRTNAAKIHPFPLGVDPGFTLDRRASEKENKYILCVGNIKPHKNIKRAILAFLDIMDDIPDYKLILVGKSEGFYSPEVGLSDILKNSDRVIFTGFVSFDELKEYYAGASVLLFPSLYEGFGLPILEAMAFNLPIIASDRASIPEVGGDSIVYINPEDRTDIGNKILEVVRGSAQCDIASYKHIMTKFTWKNCAQNTINVIKNIIG